MPTFTKEEIVHLGDLARIALTDEEITRLQGDLNVIAESINKVQEVASDDVPPTANPAPLEGAKLFFHIVDDLGKSFLFMNVIGAVLCVVRKMGTR